MSDAQLFIAVALRLGYSAGAAGAAFAAVEERLAARGAVARRYVCFRSGGGGGGGEGGGGAQSRPRLLLIFPSPDDALGFAQRSGLGASPRLSGIGLGQALATMLQRPAIGAVLVADADADAADAPRGLPPGLRVERAELLELLGALAP